MKEQQHSQRREAEIDLVVSALLDFCSKQNIHISKKISPRRLPGCGLGIYSTERILKGERLMHVPSRHLITPSSVPDSFLSKDQQGSLPTHALLAAYFALGLPEGDHRHATWMATWPSLQDFTASLPVLWPANLTIPAHGSSAHQSKRPRIESEQIKANRSLLPAPLVDAWSPAQISSAGSTPSISLLRTKLDKHLSVVAVAFPAHSVDLLTPHSPLHWRFVHMWCCINTRCFYYPPPSTAGRGQHRTISTPDPNECLALAPAMDLFNHSSGPTARTKYDKTGYFILADRNYQPGEEIFISYGCHSNDVLWAEYGFMLGRSLDDTVRIDNLVLGSLNPQERLKLSEFDRGEGCWMSHEGLSEQVTKAARMIALRHVHKGAKNDAWSRGVIQRARKTVIAWIVEVKLECEDGLQRLVAMEEGVVTETFADATDVLKAQDVPLADIELVRRQQANSRHGMCVKRWRQIWEMAEAVSKHLRA